jgi:histone-binding protein RBBP4
MVSVEPGIIAEEYKMWRKNVPFLYDMTFTHALEWPSLTVQFYPDLRLSSEEDYEIQRLLLGTHSDNEEANYVLIGEVRLPKPEALKKTDFPQEMKEIGGFSMVKGKFNIVQRIPFDSEVNRARFNPSNPVVVAAWSVSGNVYIFGMAFFFILWKKLFQIQQKKCLNQE